MQLIRTLTGREMQAGEMQVNGSRASVLVTGSPGGIGRACVTRLRKEGYAVFAGVRTPEQAVSIDREFLDECVIPLLLDVTNAEHIATACQEIEQTMIAKRWHLVGLVNNAAHEYLGPLELLPLSSIRHEMEVGFFGALALVKECLPILRKNEGARIINVSSIHGLMPVPTAGSGCIAKRSIEALSDVLRLELAPFNIKVCTVNPGPIATPLWHKTQKSLEQLSSLVGKESLELYYPQWSNAVKASRADTNKIYKTAVPPDAVAGAICRALTATRPRARYLIGLEAKWTYCLYRLLPTRWLDRVNARTYNYCDPKTT